MSNTELPATQEDGTPESAWGGQWGQTVIWWRKKGSIPIPLADPRRSLVFHQPYSSKSFNFGGIMLAFLHAKGTFPTYICLPAWAKIPSCPVQNCKVNWQKKFIFKEGSWALHFHMLLYQLIMQTEGVSISSWFAINTCCKSSLIRATYFNN